jgi:hypothetical protein
LTFRVTTCRMNFQRRWVILDTPEGDVGAK